MEMKPDSTVREFPGGAVRGGDEDKRELRPDLISPFGLIRTSRWYGLGAKKYTDRNWEKGMPFSVFWESLMRHAVKWQAGERDEDHLAAIVFNAMAIMHFEELDRVDLDDRPKYATERGYSYKFEELGSFDLGEDVEGTSINISSESIPSKNARVVSVLEGLKNRLTKNDPNNDDSTSPPTAA